MFCTNCGKEIENGSSFCSECGAKQSTVKIAPYNTPCAVGFAISLISLFLNFWGLVGIAGTIVSVVGLMSCQKRNENGKALAVIGIVLGVISILYGFYVLLSL
ncbi:MAG: zinc ribbon domain-containing protein [Bacteroides sp.]|nr:zinc ribbon domain-containing protein [Eubacterium sp.]MCM1419323.1 zinc ribbon domain-containing protein [Roseburia sp.]MCM1463149.1 zinc ribbon domain-containing protein [Bacteroides sp.]